jgi:hypothetical protein
MKKVWLFAGGHLRLRRRPLGATVVAGAPQDPANLSPQPRFGDRSADRWDVLDAKLCWLAKPLAGDRIVRVRAELSE